MAAWTLNVKDIVKQFLVYRECIVPGCAERRHLHMDLCKTHFEDDNYFPRQCEECEEVATFYNGHCFKCCRKKSDQLYGELEKRNLTDVTLAAALHLLDAYKELGDIDIVSHAVSMYTIEKDSDGLVEEPELGDAFAETSLQTSNGVYRIRRKNTPLNS